jgi:tripartite motif-containing protein 71
LVYDNDTVTTSNKKALIIAIGEYDGKLKSIDYCVNDGEEMIDTLKKLGYNNQKLIGRVNYSTLRNTIYNFFIDKSITANDTILFYFSGHGIPDNNGKVFLASSETDPEIPSMHGFSFDDLAYLFDKLCPSLRKVMILDCCYSGAAEISGKGVGNTEKDAETNETNKSKSIIDEKSTVIEQGEGKYLLAASQGYQEAYALKERGHSIFTYFLLEGLKGEAVNDDGYVTPETIGKFIHRKIVSLPFDRRPKQTPLSKGEACGEIVLAEYSHLRKKEQSISSNEKTKRTESYKAITKFGSKGSGDGQFESPKGMAVNHIGTVYVADSGNHRIQKFDSNGNFVTKWGSVWANDRKIDDGIANRLDNWISSKLMKDKFNNPSGIAMDINNVNIYVADSGNHRIQKFDSNGNFVTKWGSKGSKDGQFYYPNGIAIDSKEYVYVADRSSHRIQKFDSNGNFVTKWGSINVDFPSIFKIDKYGNIYMWYTHRIQKFDSNGNFVAEFDPKNSGESEFDQSYFYKAIAVDSLGFLFGADQHYIQKFDNKGKFITKWRIDGVADIVIDNNDFIYVANSDKNKIQKFDSNGKFIEEWGRYGDADGEFVGMSNIAIDNNDFIYIADSGLHRIQKYNSDGEFIEKMGSYGSKNGQFSSSISDIAIDSHGYVYAADFYNNRIQKFDSNGNFVTKWNDGKFNGVSDITIDNNNFIYVVDSDKRRIQKFDSNGNYVTNQPNFYHYYQDKFFDKTFYEIGEIVIDYSNNMLMSDTFFHCVYKFDSNDKFVTKWGSKGSGDGQFNTPSDIAIDSKGNVYVADSGNHRIQKFDSNGNYVTKWSYTSTDNNKLFCPELISVDNNENVYTYDSSSNQIVKFSLQQ